MSRKEQVDRVLSATVTAEYPDGFDNVTGPLIAPGEEYYFFTEEQVRKFVTRILAAADGVTEFTDPWKEYTPKPPVRQSRRSRNIVAFQEYKNRRRS